MAVVVKKNKRRTVVNSSPKSAPFVKDGPDANTASKQAATVKARRQAKRILQGLHEAAQIRAGKLNPTTFEDYFGEV